MIKNKIINIIIIICNINKQIKIKCKSNSCKSFRIIIEFNWLSYFEFIKYFIINNFFLKPLYLSPSTTIQSFDSLETLDNATYNCHEEILNYSDKFPQISLFAILLCLYS